MKRYSRTKRKPSSRVFNVLILQNIRVCCIGSILRHRSYTKLFTPTCYPGFTVYCRIKIFWHLLYRDSLTGFQGFRGLNMILMERAQVPGIYSAWLFFFLNEPPHFQQGGVIVPNCFRTPIPKLHFELLLFNLTMSKLAYFWGLKKYN